MLPFVQQAEQRPIGTVRRVAAFRDYGAAVQALEALLERCATHKLRNGLRSLVAERQTTPT